MKKLLLKYPVLFSITWALIIFALCATPGQYIPSISWLDLLSFDKLVHAFIFYVQCSALLVVKMQYQQANLFKWVYLVLSITYGMMLEWMQATMFVNRSADWMDIAANSFGCLMGFWLFGRLQKLLLNH